MKKITLISFSITECNYRQLQRLAKKHKIKATQKHDNLIDELLNLELSKDELHKELTDIA
jgi:hypothetical protein